jgi:Ca-activated chloride channel family protein
VAAEVADDAGNLHAGRPVRRRAIGISLQWLTFIVLMVAVVPSLAESARDVLVRGNAAYDAGRFEDALRLYESISEQENPEITADLLHDKAAASFKLGRLDAARELWVRAAPLKDALFEAAANYNIGNCHYAQALRLAAPEEGGPPPNASAAIELLNKAAERYRDALRLDPGLANARANLELAYQLINTLKEQSTSQPSSQPSSQPQSQPSSQPQSQPSSQPQSQPSQDGEQQQPSSQPQSQPQSQPSSQQSDEGQEGQEQPETQPSEEPESQPSLESQPAETQPADGDQEQPQLPIRMTRQEAERLLQRVRDAEKARRAALLQRERAAHRPVEKDW